MWLCSSLATLTVPEKFLTSCEWCGRVVAVHSHIVLDACMMLEINACTLNLWEIFTGEYFHEFRE